MHDPPAVPIRRSLGVVGALMALRAFALFVAATLEHWVPLSFNTASAVANGRTVDDPVGLATQLSTWDAHHYLDLAAHGYTPGTHAAAFYPLWPAVIRLGSAVMDPLAWAILAANALCAVALVTLHQWAAHRDGPDRADRFVVLFAAFPGAVFFGLAYSESLFLALSAGIFWGLDRRRWGLVAGLAALLSLTRPVGLVAALPLALAARQSGERTAWLAPVGSVAGFGAYLGWMAALTGSPWTGFEAQALFINQSSVLSVVDLPRFFTALVGVDGLHSVTGSGLDRLVFLAWAASLVGLYRRDRVLFAWTAAIGWVSVSGVAFMAFTRYAAVLAPMFWVMSDALEPETEGEPRTTWGLVVGLFGMVQLLFLLRYLSHYWVG